MVPLLLLLLACTGALGYNLTALDEYVWRPDDSYRWELIDTQVGNGSTAYTLFLVSQVWYPEKVIDQPYWWHHLQIVVPDQVQFYDFGMMRIEGGSNSSGPPGYSADMETVAVTTGCVVAKLRQIPNQPLVFWDDPIREERTEDGIIAWTWEVFRINQSDADFLLRAPMTKGAVRAMDAIAEFTQTLDPRFNITKFFPFGESKRGWTTWTLAAVDYTRVKAFAPIVLTCLNFVESLNHHYQILGGYSFVLWDYYVLNLSCYLNDPNTQRIFDVVDPYVYRERYIQPKIVIAATGDEFFIPDDSIFFFNELPEPKYYLLLPNANHGLGSVAEAIVQQAMRSFFYAIMTDYPIPKLGWTKEYTETGGRLTVTTEIPPSSVTVYYASTPDNVRRDFRLAKLDENGDVVPQPILWRSDNATMIDSLTYVAEYPNLPDTEGWFGFFIQVQFPGPKQEPGWEFIFTSEIMIIPDTLPFPRCQGAECCGVLL